MFKEEPDLDQSIVLRGRKKPSKQMCGDIKNELPDLVGNESEAISV